MHLIIDDSFYPDSFYNREHPTQKQPITVFFSQRSLHQTPRAIFFPASRAIGPLSRLGSISFSLSFFFYYHHTCLACLISLSSRLLIRMFSRETQKLLAGRSMKIKMRGAHETTNERQAHFRVHNAFLATRKASRQNHCS